MDQMQSALDRLEAKVDYQAGRIDALYALLQARGLLLLPADAGKADGLSNEQAEIEDARFHVGEATGV